MIDPWLIILFLIAGDVNFCKDSDILCSKLNKKFDCVIGVIQNQCKKFCGLCSGKNDCCLKKKTNGVNHNKIKQRISILRRAF